MAPSPSSLPPKPATWEATVEHPEPGVVCMRVTGHGDISALHTLRMALMKAAEQSSSYVVFHDWSGVTGYTSELREAYTKFIGSNPTPPAHVHLLITSRIVAMGLSVATMVVRTPLTAYTSAVSFRVAREAAIRAARAANGPPISSRTRR